MRVRVRLGVRVGLGVRARVGSRWDQMGCAIKIKIKIEIPGFSSRPASRTSEVQRLDPGETHMNNPVGI